MNRLLLFAFLWDLVTPGLIAWKVLPAASRYASHVVFVLVFVMDVAMMLRRSEVPKWVWVFLGICAYGFLMSCLNRQELLPTLWGLYLWIKYPMLCLYAYLRSWDGVPVARWLRRGCWWIIVVEVCVQVGQYLSGVEPGDALAGTLTASEANGTLVLAILVLWVLAVGLGIWVVRGGFSRLAAYIALCGVSSVLGEIKLFFFAMFPYLIVAGVLRARFTRSVRPLLFMGGLGVSVGLAFVWGYNTFVPAAEETSLQSFLLERRTLADYLNQETDMSSQEGVEKQADVGRVMALRVGWSFIDRSAATLVFGQGLGAQGESRTLGKAGAMVQGSRYGMWTGPSVVVFLVELGLAGVAVILVFCGWTCVALLRASRGRTNRELAVLIYALIIFTAHWPMYLWYTTVWAAPTGTFLYFFTLGYVLQRVGQFREVAEPVRERPARAGACVGTRMGGTLPAMGAAARRD